MTACKDSHKLMMWKAQELSTKNVWNKTVSDVSKKVIPASKTNQGLGDFLFSKMKLSWNSWTAMQKYSYIIVRT